MMESTLILFCKNNLSDDVKELLSQKLSEPIDMLYKNGLAFRLAIKYNNLQMLTALIDYYVKNILQRTAFGTTEYNISNHKLKETIMDALQSFHTSTEILEYLKTKKLLIEESSESDSEENDCSSKSSEEPSNKQALEQPLYNRPRFTV